MRQLSLRKVLSFIIIVLLAFIGLRFLLKAVSQYFVFNEASYTSYFWPKAYWLLMHLIFGMTAFLIGPFQFVPYIRERYVRTHRFLGKTYLICVLISAPAAYYLAYTSQVNLAYAAGLSGLTPKPPEGGLRALRV